MGEMARGRDKSAINPFIKYILFFENFLVWVVGLAITILGTYILVEKKKLVKDAFDFFLDPSTIMCTAGSIVYNYSLGIVFVGEIALVVFVFVFYFVPEARSSLGLFPGDKMKDAIRKYGVEDDDMVNLIDNIQKSLGCCGLSDEDNGFLDWNSNIYFNCSSRSIEKCSVPPSCCKINEGDTINLLCGRNVMYIDSATDEIKASIDASNKIYTQGCLKALGEWINANAMIIGGIMLGILLPQLFVMCLSRNLQDQIKIQKAKWDRPVRGKDNESYQS
ncbi:hypothetical protein KUTeg_005294 [Tegillarca granosa]|uniref:Tetraspanin n=1 Tax=Tegillarca granosa TaxID=220873 RepID=A0ABQ9FJC2_TEGGR|nr:hypothetical protein KUTeg_005294 [Tegillarca granosa]